MCSVERVRVDEDLKTLWAACSDAKRSRVLANFTEARSRYYATHYALAEASKRAKQGAGV